MWRTLPLSVDHIGSDGSAYRIVVLVTGMLGALWYKHKCFEKKSKAACNNLLLAAT
jgi:hypothetical protein